MARITELEAACANWQNTWEEFTVMNAVKNLRVFQLESALTDILSLYGHSSGCGKIFGFPFSKELNDGCNCGTNTSAPVRIARAALRTTQDRQPDCIGGDGKPSFSSDETLTKTEGDK